MHEADGELDDAAVARFLADGAIVLREAIPRAVAEACRDELLADVGIDPDDRTTWTAPVVRIDGRGGGCWTEAATSARLVAATSVLLGEGRWQPVRGLGTLPIRVAHPDDPGDDGWHIDAALPPVDDPHTVDYSRWGVNARADGKGLLWLVLLSEIGPDDAPTRLRLGSHRRVARALAPTGDEVVSPYPLPELDDLPIAPATGRPGDVVLCHPFLVHAAQRHRGRTPRVIAQQGVPWLARPDVVTPQSPVERAIHDALAA